ncbi:MAG: hypothetical protein ABIS03_10230, partial [Gemmatimonadaceae bacterium]
HRAMRGHTPMENTTVATPAAAIPKASDLLSDASIAEMVSDMSGTTPAPATETPAEAATAPVEGVVAETQAGDTAEPPPEEAPPEEAKPDEEAAPEPKKLAADFSVFDAEGELEVPDIKLSFKANGKEMKDVPLDRVVKLAQWGAYNEEREQSVRETRAQLSQVDEVIAEKDRTIAAYAEAYQQMLRDENFYLETRAQYEAANTPEAEVQRLRAEQKQFQQQTAERERASTEQAQANQFIGYLAPKLEALATQHPTVTFDEVFGRYNLLTAPLLVAGRMPPERFPQVDHIVDTELSQWIESQHNERTTAKQKQTATIANNKRQLARAVAPAGTIPGSGTPAKPQPKQSYQKATDIFADLPAIIGAQ